MIEQRDVEDFLIRDLRAALALTRARQEAQVCPHCKLPAVLPEVCTPEINEAIQAGIEKNAELYVVQGWTAGRS